MNLSSTQSDIEEPRFFKNDDEYLGWLNAHSDGYVLTSNQSLSPRHTVIHRATCDKIRTLKGNAKPGGFTNRYLKVYASNMNVLKNWLTTKRPDGTCRECSMCAGL